MIEGDFKRKTGVAFHSMLLLFIFILHVSNYWKLFVGDKRSEKTKLKKVVCTKAIKKHNIKKENIESNFSTKNIVRNMFGITSQIYDNGRPTNAPNYLMKAARCFRLYFTFRFLCKHVAMFTYYDPDCEFQLLLYNCVFSISLFLMCKTLLSCKTINHLKKLFLIRRIKKLHYKGLARISIEIL